MATRYLFLIAAFALVLADSSAQRTLRKNSTPASPEIGVPWKAQDLSGRDTPTLPTGDPGPTFFDGHYSGTSSVNPISAERGLISVWGDGDATDVGSSVIGYSWHFDARTGKRISRPEGDIIGSHGQMHFLITEEYPDEYHYNILCQAGVISEGSGIFKDIAGTWEATLLVFGNADGTFEWRMHIYGWLSRRGDAQPAM